MAVKVSSPWWLVVLLVIGLASLFMGERAFAHTAIASQLSWLGIALLATTIGLRAWVIAKARGRQRHIELVSMACHVGLLVALVGYWLTTDAGMSLIGVQSDSAMMRWQMVMRVLWLILLLCSLVPLIWVETALGMTDRDWFRRQHSGPDGSVLAYRVKEMASSGLSIALAAAFLMVTCNIADQRNIRKDVSYFKTSSPGSAAVNMVESLATPLRVLLFFPENNEVAPEIEEYLLALQGESENLEYELHDRLLDAKLAKEHRVAKDGMVVLIRDDKSESFRINPDINAARKRELRELDSKFQKALMSVIRDTKTAYFMTGHGELNDPDSVGALGMKSALKKSTLIKKALGQLNYKVKDYDGFGKPVPDDCSILFILAPRIALLEDELRAVDDYLAGGGAAIIAMDTDAEMRLGVLKERLGVTFNPTPIADDKEFMVQTRTVADHSYILTNQFLSHASISALSRGAARSAILFVSPGSFDDVPLGEPHKGNKANKVIRSMSTSFRDVVDATGDRNHQFDKNSEKRDRYSIVVAIEGPVVEEKSPEESATGEDKTPMRVVLLADAEVLSDSILGRVAVVQNLLVDLVKWTGGEEAYAGETISETDKRIEHTKSQDARWFYGTMVGAPLLMLGIGLLFVRRRKRRRKQS